MKKTLLTIALTNILGFLITGYAQSNFSKGFVIKSNGDTLQGFINQREFYKNPKSIQFKLLSTADKIAYLGVADIQYFEITGSDQFIRSFVSISMNEVELTNLREGTPPPPSQSDTVFLKIISRGSKADFFLYRDKLKTRFFFRKPASPIEELLFRRELVSGSVKEINFYKSQLNLLVGELNLSDERLTKFIAKSRYLESDIKKIASDINKNSDEPVKPVKEKKSKFYIGTGLVGSWLKYTGSIPIAEGNPKNSVSWVPMISIGFVTPLTDSKTPKLNLCLDANYFAARYNVSASNYDASSGVTTTAHQQINQRVSSFSLQLMYYFYNKPKVNLFIAGGFRINLGSETSNTYVISQFYPGFGVTYPATGYTLANFWISEPVSIGVLILKKFEGSLTYLPNVQVTNDFDAIGKIHFAQINFKVRF